MGRERPRAESAAAKSSRSVSARISAGQFTARLRAAGYPTLSADVGNELRISPGAISIEPAAERSAALRWPAPEGFMKLIVFGSTGGTGKALVGAALAAGHAVTA